MMKHVILILGVLIAISYGQVCAHSQYFNGQRCAPCQENCRCSRDNACSSCLPGYTFDSKYKNCVACPTATSPRDVGCSQCCYQIVETAFVCSQCPDLEYTHLYGGQCVRLEGCISASSSGYCKVCDQGYYQYDGSCNACDASCATCTDSSFCLTCAPNYFNATNSNYGTCESCPLGCSACSDSSTCTACVTGYRLTTPTCTACTAHCTTCTAAGCSACETGYAAIGGNCIACTDGGFGGTAGCLQCHAAGSLIKCDSCADSYYLAANEACYTCHSLYPNSALCTLSKPLQCINDNVANLASRYYLVGNTCVANTKNCKGMKNALGDCSSCYFEQGYYYQLQSTTCNLCVKTGCQIFSRSCQCLGCLTGYQYINYQCVACQNQHCAKCQSSVTSCEQCNTRYGIISSACISCVQTMCLNCDGNTTLCVTCQDGYYNSEGYCYQCQDSCEVCTSSTSCSECSIGYYLHSSGRCKSKPTNCVDVDESGRCTKCEYGYMASYGSCFPCSTTSYNMHHCERYCPSYYALLVFEDCVQLLLLSLTVLSLFVL